MLTRVTGIRTVPIDLQANWVILHAVKVFIVPANGIVKFPPENLAQQRGWRVGVIAVP